MSIKKYNPLNNFENISPKIVGDLMKGYTNLEVCIKYGISETTLYKWKRVNAKFKDSCDKAERYAARSIIKQGLNKLAQGSEVSEEVTEFYDVQTCQVTGEEQKVKRIIKTRKLPPDVKALRMLASKHAQGEYLENEAQKNGININVITQKDRALSIEERKAIILRDKLEGETPIDAEYKEIGGEEE